MRTQAIQLAVIKELEMDYAELQDRDKHLRARKRRNGGVL